MRKTVTYASGDDDVFIDSSLKSYTSILSDFDLNKAVQSRVEAEQEEEENTARRVYKQ